MCVGVCLWCLCLYVNVSVFVCTCLFESVCLIVCVCVCVRC